MTAASSPCRTCAVIPYSTAVLHTKDAAEPSATGEQSAAGEPNFDAVKNLAYRIPQLKHGHEATDGY